MQLRNLRIDDDLSLVGSEVPLRVYGEGTRGPRVGVMAGVHGCEYVAMAALQKFLDSVDESRIKGELRVITMANAASFWTRTSFVVPHDGKNLNRSFPGNPEGSFTERLAHVIFQELIRPVDFFIDMHSGDLVEDLEPFVLFEESDVTDRARALAQSYGLGHVVRVVKSDSPISGTASGAAAEIGIAAITAEVGRCGLLEHDAVDQHERGLRRALVHTGVLEARGEEEVPTSPPLEHSSWAWLRSPISGWWSPRVSVGHYVEAGEQIGEVREIEGLGRHVVSAPSSGYLLFMTSSPAVDVDGLLLGLAC